MKKISISEYAKALYEVTKDLKGVALKSAIEAFAALLFRHNNVKKTKAIITAFELYAQKQAGEVQIEITTARAVDKGTMDAIKKIFGDKVEATHRLQEDLIGGVIVRSEDTILDASIKTQLRNLQAYLA